MVCNRKESHIITFALPCAPRTLQATKSFTPSIQRFHWCQVPRQRSRLHSICLIIEANDPLFGSADSSVEWVTLNKGKVSELLDFSKLDARSRRGVSLSRNKTTVLKGTQLAEFPEGTFLTPAIAKTLLKKECYVASDSSLNIGDEALFALCLLVERARKERSLYSGLLQALPNVDELDSPDFWSDEELDMLRGSPVRSKFDKIRDAIEEEWKSLNQKLFEPNRNKFPEDDFSLELYKWALGIVDSRTVSAGSAEPRVLAPVLHNLRPPGGDSKAIAQVETNGGMFFGKKRIVLSLDVDSMGGDEITVSSGKGAYNSDHLLERGEVIGNGANKLEICFQLTELDRFYEDKVNILELAEVDVSPSFDMVEAEKNRKWEAPENMEAYLRLLCLGGADAFLLEGVFRGEVWGFMKLPVSEENEKAMCEVMIGACEDILEGYWEGEVVAKKSSKRRIDMAKAVVEGEKKIAMAALKTYKGRMSSLDAVEYYAERRLKMLDLLRPVDESEIVDSESGARMGRAFDENY